MISIVCTSMLVALLFNDNPPAPTPQAVAQAQKDGKEGKDQLDVFEDRTVTVIGRVIHKQGIYALRIKGFGNTLAAAESQEKKADDPKHEVADATKPTKSREHKTLKVNEDIHLLRSAVLEDLEDEVGLKPVETKGEEEVEKSALVQVSGILTMYKGQPYIFLQHFKTTKDLPQLEKQIEKAKKLEDQKKPS